MLKKWTQCRQCKSKQSPTIPAGYFKTEEIKNGIHYIVTKECLCHKNWRLEEEKYQKFISSGFDKDKYNLNFEDYKGTQSIGNITRLKNYIELFPKDDKVRKTILYFWGLTDTQKTTVATIIANKLLSHFDIRYKICDDLFKIIIDNQYYPENEEYEIKVQQCINCDLLIIDDVFNEIYTDKQLPFLEKFIQKRIDNKKGIIFISNVHLADIKNMSIKNLIKKYTDKNKTEFNFFDIYNDIPEVLF